MTTPQYTPTVPASFWLREDVALLLQKHDTGKIPANRIEAEHVAKSSTLQRIGYNFLYATSSRLDFVTSLQGYVKSGRDLSPAQLKGALNVMLAEWRAKKQHEASQPKQQQPEQAPEPQAPATPSAVTPVAYDGTYTIVLDEAGSYRTLRLFTPDEDTAKRYNLPQGAQIAQYLSGADNDSSYTGFAFVFGSELRIWKRYQAEAPLTKALTILVSADKEQQIDYGAAYAMASKRCWRCGRTLTVPASLHRGMGPICAEKL